MAYRVIHYINQFFAGIGGEDKADVAPEVREGVVGPGMAFKAALGGEGNRGDSSAATIISPTIWMKCPPWWWKPRAVVQGRRPDRGPGLQSPDATARPAPRSARRSARL